MVATPYPLPRSLRRSDVMAGDGGTAYGPFGDGWGIFDTADVAVWLKYAGETEFALDAGVTVTRTDPSAAYSTFSIEFGAALVAGDSFYVEGARSHERSLAVTRGGQIDSDMLEREFSKTAVVLQELRRDANDRMDEAGRMLRVPPGESVDALPAAGLRTSTILAFGAGGAPELITLPTLGLGASLNVTTVATRLLLSGLATSVGVAFLAEDKRAGFFAWVPGNQSAYVTADVGQGLFVAPASDTSGASGAWIRRGFDVLNPFMFGALGDGTTDDATAMSRAINMALFFNAGLFIPPGAFRLASQVVAAPGATQNFALWGEGRTSRILVANSTGGLRFNLGSRPHVKVSKLSIEPAVTGGGGSGTGLWLEGPYSGGSDKVMAWIDDVGFVPADQNNSDGWFHVSALRVEGCKRPRIENVVYIPGALVPAGSKATALLDTSGSYQVSVDNCRFSARALYAHKHAQAGQGNEGFYVRNSILTGGDYGVFYQDTALSPGGVITGNHINSMLENIHLDGLKFGEVSGNLLYCNLDEIKYTYTQSGSTVTVTADQDHFFITGDNFTIDSATGGLATGAIGGTITVTDASHFTFTAGDSATRSGTLVIGTTSSRRFTDIRMPNCSGMIIERNTYQTNKATNRRHVTFSTSGSASGAPILRDNRVSKDLLLSTSLLTAYFIGNGAEGTLIEWDKVPAQGSYAAGMLDVNASAVTAGCGGRPSDPLLYSDTVPVSSAGIVKALMSYDVPPLWLNGQRGVRCEMFGETANNANVKTIRFDVGAVQVASVSLATGVAGVWSAVLTVRRSGPSTQRWRLECDNNGAVTVQQGTTTHNEATAMTVRATTNVATGTGDLTQNSMTVEFV